MRVGSCLLKPLSDRPPKAGSGGGLHRPFRADATRLYLDAEAYPSVASEHVYPGTPTRVTFTGALSSSFGPFSFLAARVYTHLTAKGHATLVASTL